MKIKTDTPEDKAFWDSWPKGNPDEVILPHIGDDWWNAEKELSFELCKLEKIKENKKTFEKARRIIESWPQWKIDLAKEIWGFK